MKRVLSAVVFLPVFYLIVRKGPPALYFVLLATAALLALLELFRLAAAGGHRCHTGIGIGLSLLTLVAFIDERVRIEWVLAAALVLLPLASLGRRGDWPRALGDIGSTLFIALFTGTLFGYLARLRLVSAPEVPEAGSDMVFLLFLVVWGADVAAYYVGSRLGRRPLAPRVSPKKTVEGALAGCAGAIAAAFLARATFMHRLEVSDCVLLGLVLGLSGLLGDLVESMLKRGAGLKDSAAIVPGHGGILDRVDSLLYAAPVLYYYYLLAMRTH